MHKLESNRDDAPVRAVGVPDYLGVAGLFLFAGFGWVGTAVMNAGLLLMLVAAVISRKLVARVFRYEPLVWLALGFVVYVCVVAAVSATRWPEHAGVFWDEAVDLASLWLFPLIAWWLSAKTRRVYLVMALAAGGLLARMLLNLEWSHPAAQLLETDVYGFGLTHVAFGLYSGTVVLGIVVLWPAALSAVETRGARLWISLAAFVSLMVFVQGLMTSGSRGAMVAVLCGAVAALTFWSSRVIRRKQVVSWKAAIGVGLLSAAAITAILWVNTESLTKRLEKESEVYGQILDLDLESVRSTSLGDRVHMAIHGLDMWAERPISGWGPGSAEHLLDLDPRLAAFPHFHNSYVQLLAELGFLGMLFFAGGLILLARGGWRAWQNDRLPTALAVFLVGAWVMLLVWSLIDTRLGHVDQRFLLLMLCGVTYTFVLGPRNGSADTRVGCTAAE